MTGTYNAVGRDGQPTQGGWQRFHRRRRELRAAHPGCAGARRRRSPAVRGYHHLFAAAALERRPRHSGRCGGPGRTGPHGRQTGRRDGCRVTVLSQSLKKMEDGLRLGAKRYYATADTDTFKTLRNSFDIILNTVSGRSEPRTVPGHVGPDGVFVELGLPETRWWCRHSRCWDATQHQRLGHRRHSGDPGNVGLLRWRTASSRDRGHRAGITSTRPMSGSSPAMSGIASSSIPSHCATRSDSEHRNLASRCRDLTGC